MIEQNFSLYMDLEELAEKTGPKGYDKKWVQSLYSEVKKTPDYTIHRKEMLDRLEEISKCDKAISIAISNLFEEQPYLITRYDNKYDRSHLEEDEKPECELPITIDNRQYLVRIQTPLDLHLKYVNMELTRQVSPQQILELKNNEMVEKKMPFNMEISELENGRKKTVLAFNEKKIDESHPLIKKLDDLMIMDNELLANAVENNPAFKSYLQKREMITHILTRTENDSFLQPATQESVKVFQEIITQEKIYGMKIENQMSFTKKNMPNLGNN